MIRNTLRQRPDGLWKGILTVGFLALCVAILSARSVPASGYELSLYAATPSLFWLGSGVGFGLSLLTAMYTSDRWEKRLALLLGGTTLTAVVSLPLIRGYYYYGMGDALRHLGWTRDLTAGEVNALSMFYPGIHSVSGLIGTIAGLSIARSILVMGVCFVLVFVLFVPLLLRSLAPRSVGVLLATFSGFLLLPINNVSTQLAAHPVSQTILFAPLVLYLLFGFLLEGGDRSPWSSYGLLLALASVVTVLYHPQIALNLLLMFFAVSFVQYLARRFRPHSAVSHHRPLYTHTALLVIVFVGWTLQFELFYNTIRAVGGALHAYITGTTTAAPVVADRGTSLSAIGSGLWELFVRLFSVEALYSVLALGVILLGVLGKLDDATESRALVTYSVASFSLLLPVAALQFFGNVSKLFFRNFGFLMVFVTLLGAIGLARVSRAVSAHPRTNGRRSLFGGLMALLLVVSLVTVFPSPLIYQPSSHVSEAQMNGYETAFAHQSSGVTFAGIRGGPWRYSDALYGFNGPDHARYSSVPNGDLADLQRYFESTHYLIVTEVDRKRELTAYRELRYTREGFASLDDQRGVAKVQTNGEFTLYFVPNEGTE